MLSRARTSILGLTLIALPCACGNAAAPSGESAAPESDSGQASLTANFHAGATLRTTANVNLRSGPSTSKSILDVVPKGTEVVAASGTLSNGFAHITWDGEDGYASATYLALVADAPAPTPVPDPTPTPAPSGEGPSADDLLAAVSGCNPVSSKRWATDAKNPIKSGIPICSSPGAVYFTADLDIDCDGSKNAGCTVDHTQMGDTAWHTSTGAPLDAALIPFVVVPGDMGYSSLGITGGTVVAVVYQGHVAYGIVGDVGPSHVIGEVSYAMAAELPGVNTNPNTGGIEAASVTYVFFPGSGGRVSHLEDVEGARALGQSLATKLVNGG